MSRDALLEPYLQEAASWERDRERQSRRTLKLACWGAMLGWGAAGLACMALAALAPLKRVEPFLVRVDSSTGVVDVAPVYQGGAPLSEAVTRYLLTHYVQVCERFVFGTAESDYEECGAFHTPQLNQAWAAKWAFSNPASPLNLYRDGTTIRSQVTSVSFFKRANGVEDLAQVRYYTAKRASGATDEFIAHYIATLQYSYVAPASEPKTRRWNPLGFRVMEFHPEPELSADNILNNAAPASTHSATPISNEPARIARMRP